MTALNAAVLQAIRSRAEPGFFKAFVAMLDTLPALEGFRAASAGLKGMPLIRFEDGAVAGDALPVGAHAVYRAATKEGKPSEIVLSVDAFQGSPTITRLLSVVDDIAHEFRHHERVGERTNIEKALKERATTPQDAGAYVDAMLDDETAARYAGYQVWKDAAAADPGEANRIHAMTDGNPVFARFGALEREVASNGLTGAAAVQWIVENSRHEMARVGTYRERFAAHAAEVIGIDAQPFQAATIERLRSEAGYDVNHIVHDDGSGTLDIRYADGSGVATHFDAAGEVHRRTVSTRLWDGALGIETYDGGGVLISVCADRPNDAASVCVTSTYADGRVTTRMRDGAPQPADAAQTANHPHPDVQGESADPSLGDVLGAVSDVNALVQALRGGDLKAMALAGGTVLGDVGRLTGIDMPLDADLGGMRVLAGRAMALVQAVQGGDGLHVATAASDLAADATRWLAGVAHQEALDAFEAGLPATGPLFDASRALGQVTGALGMVGSAVSLWRAIDAGDPYQIAGAAMSTVAAGLAVAGVSCPPLAAAAVVVQIAQTLFADEDIPTREGEATAVWSPDGRIEVLTTVDAEQGGATPTRLLERLVRMLEQTLADQAEAHGLDYAIVPQRLPTIGYAYDPDGYLGNVARFGGGSPGHLYLKWIDDHGNPHTRYFDGAGGRNQDGQPSLMHEFLARAVEALVPAWEAHTVLHRMRDAGVLSSGPDASVASNRERVARQLGSDLWQAPDDRAGLPVPDTDGIGQRFVALTVDVGDIGDTTAAAPARIGRDVDLDGYIEQTEWVGANEALLCIDLDGNGRIDQNEILTTDPAAAAAHARNSVSWLDVNGDGRLDRSDPAFGALVLWRDVNRNGATDAGETSRLIDRGVVALDFRQGAPVLVGGNGAALSLTEHCLHAELRGDAYAPALIDTDGDGNGDVFAGVLHASEGSGTVLEAVVTHDYTGEPGHTHGGVGEPDASGNLLVEQGDARIRAASDRRHEQALAEDVIVAGDIRVRSSAGPTPTDPHATATTVALGDARLASGLDHGVRKPSQRVDTVPAGDARVASASPSSVVDAYAAVRASWRRNADSVFGGAGALSGVAIGAVGAVAAIAGTAYAQSPADAGVDRDLARARTDAARPADGPPQANDGDAAGWARPHHRPESAPAPPAPHFHPVTVHSLARGAAAPPDGMPPCPVPPQRPLDISRGPVAQTPAEPAAATPPGHSAIIAAPAGLSLLPPDVASERVSGVEDRRYIVDAQTLLANDSARNHAAAPLRLVQVYGAEHGTATMLWSADGLQRVVFTPDADYWGPARFCYTVMDAYGMMATGRVDIDIAPVNDAPLANDDAVTMAEDQAIVLLPRQLLANDTDVDTATVGDVLQIVRVADASHGLVALDARGNVRFLPDQDYFGPASFAYWVSDGAGGLSRAVVHLDIEPVNDAPLVTGETISTDEDTVLSIDPAALLANDRDVDNSHDALSVIAVRSGRHGTVTLEHDGRVRFVPERDYYGLASFFYTVADGSGGFTEGRATVDLAPVNDAPIVTGERFGGREDEVATFAAKALLANDRDVDDRHADLRVVAASDAMHGEVRWQPDGSVVFVPEADYFGAAGFAYTVSDPHGATSTARVDIELAPVNDAPRVRGETLDGVEDTALTIAQAALLANDSDIDNPHEDLAIVRVASARHGHVALQLDGSIRFVPEQDYFGLAAFDYEVSDGAGGLATATATVRVAPVNDAPVANDNVVQSRTGVSVTMTEAALLADDFDIDNPHSDLHIVGVSGADHGTVRLNADNSVTFTPQPGYGGYPGAHGSFDYTISDGSGGFATATGTVVLEKVNTTPVAVDDGLTGYENMPFVIAPWRLLANDTDPDGDTIALADVGNARHGAVALQPDGQIRFTPDAGFHGQAAFQYLIADPYGGRTWGTALLDVVHVNAAPVVEAIEYGRAVFGYYYGPAPEIGRTWSGAANVPGDPIWAGNVHGERPQHVFQPLYDEGVARELMAQGRLYDRGGGVYQPGFYQNGMMRPLELDAIDARSGEKGSTIDADIMYRDRDDPQRQMGRVIAYDPDGDASALVVSIGAGPEHGHAYANAYANPQAGYLTPDHTALQHGMIASPHAWQYISHRGDPYNGADGFVLTITDSEGATTQVMVDATHKGTNASGALMRATLAEDNVLAMPAKGTAADEAQRLATLMIERMGAATAENEAGPPFVFVPPPQDVPLAIAADAQDRCLRGEPDMAVAA
jgi:hypothetical protein